jgi:hypothetical protein
MDDDVSTLARMIHAAVSESDRRAGLLSPVKVGRLLWQAFPGMTEDDASRAVQYAASFRGRTLP